MIIHRPPSLSIRGGKDTNLSQVIAEPLAFLLARVHLLGASKGRQANFQANLKFKLTVLVTAFN